MTLTANIAHAVTVLQNGGIGVIPTDTIYGIVASAHDPRAIERLYTVRKRREDKPCLVLIDDVNRVSDFGVRIDHTKRETLEKLWSNDRNMRTHVCADLGIPFSDRPVSIILPTHDDRFFYIHRGCNSIGFRIPQANSQTMRIIRTVGPLIAPSANISNQKMINKIDYIRSTFTTAVDFYVHDPLEQQRATASIIISMMGDDITLLRA